MRTLEEVENTQTGEKSMAIVYYAVEEHDEAYAGPQTLGKTAQVIMNSHGPSGSNLDYFKNIIKFLKGTGAKDFYLESLDDAVEKA